MQLIITVKRNNQELETFTLYPPKEVTFGRKSATGFADKQFVDDTLSRHHFRISAYGDTWRLEDLKSENGTKVDGKRVNTKTLVDGDVISAGHLEFHLRVLGATGVPEGGKATETPETHTEEIDGENEVVALANAGKLKVPCSLETAESGQTMFHGELGKVETISELILGLRQVRPFRYPWLVISQAQLESPLPDALKEAAAPIVDWVSPEYSKRYSPLLVSLKRLPYACWAEFVNASWGHDLFYVIFEKIEQDALLELLRGASRQGTAISGVLWSSVLSCMLMKSRSGPSERLASSCSAILTEVPDLPERWMMFAMSTVKPSLEKLGFVCEVVNIEAETQKD